MQRRRAAMAVLIVAVGVLKAWQSGALSSGGPLALVVLAAIGVAALAVLAARTLGQLIAAAGASVLLLWLALSWLD